MKNLKIGNLSFVALSCCTFGDYGGAGDVGRANLNVLKDQFKARYYSCNYSSFESDGTLMDERWYRSLSASDFDGVDLVILEGDYSSESAYLREPGEDEGYRAEFDDIVGGLENYPILDEDELYKVQMEWADEALADIARYSIKALNKHDISEDLTLADVWDELSIEQCTAIVEDAYRKASENYDIATYEYNGAYIDEDALLPFIVQALAGEWHNGYKLTDGTLVDLGAIETEPNPYPVAWKDTADYVAKFTASNHWRGE